MILLIEEVLHHLHPRTILIPTTLGGRVVQDFRHEQLLAPLPEAGLGIGTFGTLAHSENPRKTF